MNFDQILYALWSPEIVSIARKERISYLAILEKLSKSGPESLPATDGEILCDKVRKEMSAVKVPTFECLDKLAPVLSVAYVRTIAINRTILNNMLDMRASWLTVCNETAQVVLPAGGNDLSSIMIEENVVSVPGMTIKLSFYDMHRTNAGAGFQPRFCTPNCTFIDIPFFGENFIV